MITETSRLQVRTCLGANLAFDTILVYSYHFMSALKVMHSKTALAMAAKNVATLEVSHARKLLYYSTATNASARAFQHRVTLDRNYL